MLRELVLTATVIVSLTPHLPAQTTVFAGGIENAASESYPSLPGGAIAQGSMFVIYGSEMGIPSNPADLKFPLPTSEGLLGTNIQVTSGTTTVDAIMIYTTPGQVAAILPSNTPVTPVGSPGTLTLTYQGKSSSTPINIVRSSFGSFTLNTSGGGPGIVQNFVSASEIDLNTLTSPTFPGQTVILWGTGLGPVSGKEADMPLPGDMKDALGVQVWVGSKPATVSYAGRSGCCAALDQVIFVVPEAIQGCYVPVVVKAGGVVSNFTSMSVAPSVGGACSDADGIDPADLKTLQSDGSVRLGAVNFTRIGLNVTSKLGPIVGASDTVHSIFGKYSSGQLWASLGVTQSPSVGSCTVSQFLGLNPLPTDPIKPTSLDAGSSLSINGPAGTKAIASTSTGVYSATLGGENLDELLTGTPAAPYLLAGSYTINGTGGSAVGSFATPFTIPSDVTWTNSADITTIDRTKDLTITWSGGSANNFVAISGLGVVPSAGALGPSTDSPGNVFLCIAPASAGTFTVPSIVLQALPPSSTISVVPTSFLLVGTQTAAVKFSSTGLDHGYVTYRSLSGNNVTIK